VTRGEIFMEHLKPTETELRGQRVVIDGVGFRDPVTGRIYDLITHELVEVGVGDEGWSKLYRDPGDGRYWELTYPESEYHGGGPPMLTHVSNEFAAKKYGIS
jgi:hypothetical protein